MTVRVAMGAMVSMAILAVIACSDTRRSPALGMKAARTTTDTTLAPEVVASWGAQGDFFIKGEFTILDWESAKAVLLRRECRGGKMYHTGWVTIYSRDGGSYLTREPEIDAFLTFMRERGLPMEGFAPE